MVKYGDNKASVEPPPPSARRQWGGRAGTVLNLMEGADIIDAHEGRAPSVGSDPQTPASPTSPSDVCPLPAPSVVSKGATITISKGPASKGAPLIQKPAFPVQESKAEDQKDGEDDSSPAQGMRRVCREHFIICVFL